MFCCLTLNYSVFKFNPNETIKFPHKISQPIQTSFLQLLLDLQLCKAFNFVRFIPLFGIEKENETTTRRDEFLMEKTCRYISVS